jgi:hypothetical protein
MRTRIIGCDRCGQNPLPEKTEQITMSPDLAKNCALSEEEIRGPFAADLCRNCATAFVLFMKRQGVS